MKHKEDSIPWREVVKDLFDKYTEAGATLKGYRLKMEMTQKELGATIGVSQNHISEMEHGKRPIGKAMAKKLAALFKINYRLFL